MNDDIILMLQEKISSLSKGQKKIAAQLLNPVATRLNWDYVYEEMHPLVNN